MKDSFKEGMKKAHQGYLENQRLMWKTPRSNDFYEYHLQEVQNLVIECIKSGQNRAFFDVGVNSFNAVRAVLEDLDIKYSVFMEKKTSCWIHTFCVDLSFVKDL